MTEYFPVMYVPMPLNANGDGPADAADAVSVAHEIWDAETNVTICTAKDEATANLIVSAWNLRTQAPDSWRPIETAPKDGTHVLLTEGANVWEGRAVEYRDELQWWERNAHPTDYCGPQDFPTHWMPLPAAPALRPQTAESGK